MGQVGRAHGARATTAATNEVRVSWRAWTVSCGLAGKRPEHQHPGQAQEVCGGMIDLSIQKQPLPGQTTGGGGSGGCSAEAAPVGAQQRPGCGEVNSTNRPDPRGAAEDRSGM